MALFCLMLVFEALFFYLMHAAAQNGSPGWCFTFLVYSILAAIGAWLSWGKDDSDERLST